MPSRLVDSTVHNIVPQACQVLAGQDGPSVKRLRMLRVGSKTSGVGWGDDMIVTIHVLDVTARAPYKKGHAKL